MKRLETIAKPKQTEATFTLTGRVKSKKNSKQILKTKTGRPFIASSKLFLQWEQEAILALRIQKLNLEKQGQVFPIKGKIRLFMRFEMLGKQHEPDVSNLVEGPQDLLQALEIIENDKQVIELHALKIMDSVEDLCTIHVSQSLER